MNENPVNSVGRIVSIQVGMPTTFTYQPIEQSQSNDLSEKTWKTGFLKEPVVGPVWLGAVNIAGDGQADLVHHGGLHKAVCVYSDSHFPFWRKEMNLPELDNGAFGENFTVNGLTESDVCIGDHWRIGAAIVQVSQPRQPCWKLARRWNIKKLAHRVQETGKTGWYFRVLTEGMIEAPSPIELVSRTHPEWSVAAANRIMHHDKSDLASAATLASLPELSPNWQTTLLNRIQHRSNRSDQKRLEGGP